MTTDIYSPLGKAVTYANTRWTQMAEYATTGDLPILERVRRKTAEHLRFTLGEARAAEALRELAL